MTVKWLFEKDAYDDGNTERMIEHCKQKKIEYQKIDFVLFGTDYHIDWAFGPEECVIMYGTIGLVKFIQRKKKWYPGAWSDWEELKCTTFLSHWGQFSVQEDYTFLPIAEVNRRWNDLFMKYQFDGHIFIKPNDNDKRFHGEKVADEFRDQWYKTAQIYGAPISSLALVSKPTCIKAEWRFIIANRKIVSGSLYRADGRTGLSRIDPDWVFDKNAIEFAEKVVNSTEWQPAPIYALDVCMVESGQFKLMEVGSLNCCGLYKCDVAAIMDAANEIAIREWRETHEI